MHTLPGKAEYSSYRFLFLIKHRPVDQTIQQWKTRNFPTRIFIVLNRIGHNHHPQQGILDALALRLKWRRSEHSGRALIIWLQDIAIFYIFEGVRVLSAWRESSKYQEMCVPCMALNFFKNWIIFIFLLLPNYFCIVKDPRCNMKISLDFQWSNSLARLFLLSYFWRIQVLAYRYTIYRLISCNKVFQ